MLLRSGGVGLPPPRRGLCGPVAVRQTTPSRASQPVGVRQPTAVGVRGRHRIGSDLGEHQRRFIGWDTDLQTWRPCAPTPLSYPKLPIAPSPWAGRVFLRLLEPTSTHTHTHTHTPPSKRVPATPGHSANPTMKTSLWLHPQPMPFIQPLDPPQSHIIPTTHSIATAITHWPAHSCSKKLVFWANTFHYPNFQGSNAQPPHPPLAIEC